MAEVPLAAVPFVLYDDDAEKYVVADEAIAALEKLGGHIGAAGDQNRQWRMPFSLTWVVCVCLSVSASLCVSAQASWWSPGATAPGSRF